jgi:hypothetical protein
MKNKPVVIGSLQDFTGMSVEKKCEQCGQPCFFHDKWDFKKYYIICLQYAIQMKDEEEEECVFQVHPQTVRNLAKIYGITQLEASILIKQMMDGGNFEFEGYAE